MIEKDRLQLIEENWDECDSFSRSEVGATASDDYITRDGELWNDSAAENAFDDYLNECLPEWQGQPLSGVLEKAERSRRQCLRRNAGA